MYTISFLKLELNDDVLMKHVLCYGSKVWGYCNTIETVHNDFCKRDLFVDRTTNNSMSLGEWGRLPLCIRLCKILV